jgi:hypothetical protein
MPLIREQLNSDPVMARLTAHSTAEFRLVVASGFAALVALAAVVALFTRGTPAWLAAVVCVFLAAIGVYRLRKERALLADYATIVATVSQWSKTEGPDGGYLYSVRYRFLGPDGRLYSGESGSTQKVLPLEGETIPVLYRRADPGRNMPLATFIFYRFTYTGAE